MMRTKITVTTILGLALMGCPADGGNATATATDSNATESDTESDSDEDSNSNSNSNTNDSTESETDNPTTTDTTLTTDPDSSSTEPAETSTGGDECTEADACIEDTDCLPGQTCIGCLCIGQGMGCAEWADAGVYGDCVNEGSSVCDGGSCLGGGEGIGVCFFTPCETACDCPQPPAGFEEQVTCENITAMGEEPDCFIGCAGGLDCPEGMGCFQGAICMFGVEVVMGLPPYSDCVNMPGAMCEDGFCLVDDTDDPTFGTCANACEDAGDCVVPETGDIMPVCNDFGGGTTLCQLECAPADTCPDGMECQFGYCGWAEVAPYGDCENNPPAEACLAPDTCIDTAEGGICGSPCMDAGDCEAAPATGDAVVQCTDLGDGNICNLSCAMGETCPNGMDCFNDLYCHFTPS